MKEDKKKNRFPRLSLKILLTHFVIQITFFGIIYSIYRIALVLGLQIPDSREEVAVWMRAITTFLPIVTVTSVVIIFSFAINRLVVKRIYKLEKVTKEVLKGNFGITVDVTCKDEIAELSESFNMMSKELQANEYLSKEFVRNVSHEFKTPISVIRAYGEMLDLDAEKGILDIPAVRQYAKIIMSESDRLTAMSKSILQLSQLDSTTLIKKDESVRPAEQIRDIFRLMQVKWADKNIALDLQLEEVTIKSNTLLLYQVWQNLISNAIKFSEKNGIITVTLKSHEGGAFFEIHNNGALISDEDKAKIFDHFYMTDTSRNIDGNGLGLAIVKKILSKLGGQIGFESKEGAGTKFFVRL